MPNKVKWSEVTPPHNLQFPGEYIHRKCSNLLHSYKVSPPNPPESSDDKLWKNFSQVAIVTAIQRNIFLCDNFHTSAVDLALLPSSCQPQYAKCRLFRCTYFHDSCFLRSRRRWWFTSCSKGFVPRFCSNILPLPKPGSGGYWTNLKHGMC
jgi:hypothetical protein